MMTLTELYDHGKTFATYAFDKTGEIMPMWICLTEDGELLPIVVMMDDDKDRVVAGLRKLFKEKRIVRYVSMMEGWMLRAKDKKQTVDDLIKDGPIRNHPDRREVITIEASDRTGQSKMGLCYILRPEHGKPKLSPFEDGDENCGGRFSNLLMEIQ